MWEDRQARTSILEERNIGDVRGMLYGLCAATPTGTGHDGPLFAEFSLPSLPFHHALNVDVMYEV